MKNLYNNRFLKHLDFNEYEKQQIEFAIEHNKNKISDNYILYKHIMRLKECNVSFSRLWLRLEKIINLGRDSSSKKSYYYRYGLKYGYKKFKEKTKKCTLTRDDYIKKYGKEEGEKKLRKRGASLEIYIENYGEKEGKRRWNEYLNKRKRAYQRNRENNYQYARYTENYYISLYGHDEGKRRYKNKKDKQRYKVSKQRYIDEFGKEGEDICRNIKDNLSLESFQKRYGDKEGLYQYNKFIDSRKGKFKDKFIKKYGKEEGEKKYNDYIKYRRFIPNINGYIKRYGEEKGIELYQQVHNNSYYVHHSVSKLSINFFNELKIYISDLENYGLNEIRLSLNEEDRKYCGKYHIRLDCEYKGRVIELNGDVFHANPKKFDPEDKPHPYKKDLTAKEIWDQDRIRKEILESKGFEVMFIWEDDINENRGKVIRECLHWLLRK